MKTEIIDKITSNSREGKKAFAILLDPDKIDSLQAIELAKSIESTNVNYVLIGGSLMMQPDTSSFLNTIKQHTSKPLILFPGSPMQINQQADAILFLSLISGRNPEMLIGSHVVSAPILKKSAIEVIPTGYMLIESGNITSVLYMSQTLPIPRNKPDIAMSTALAGELLGMKLIYMDAGSGAEQSVPLNMIKRVKEAIDIPLIVGGGVKTAEQIKEIYNAGADIVVVGNILEKQPWLLKGFTDRNNL